MKYFRCYRPNPPDNYVDDGYARPVDQVQFEGIEWSDGTVSIRWLTVNGSFANWPSLEDVLKIHGHPEYGTRIEWLPIEIEAKTSQELHVL